MAAGFAIALYLIKNNGNYMGESRLHYGMSLRLYFEEKKLLDREWSCSFQEVDMPVLGCKKAAKAMNMAYSKAWKMLKGAEKRMGICLTDRETGGKDSGGSTLTPQAERAEDRGIRRL